MKPSILKTVVSMEEIVLNSIRNTLTVPYMILLRLVMAFVITRTIITIHMIVVGMVGTALHGIDSTDCIRIALKVVNGGLIGIE